MKCLEKDPARRYSSAAELAQDIQRHCTGLPVVAAPPAVSYRLRKFARRHKVGVLAGGAALAALIVGLISTTIAVFWALGERDGARRAASDEVAHRTLAEAAKKSAQQANLVANQEKSRAQEHAAAADAQARRAEAVTTLLNEVLQPPSEPDDERTALTLSERIEVFSAGLSDRLVSEPVIEASLRRVLANTHSSLNQHEQAEAEARRSLELFRTSRGEFDPAVDQSLEHLLTILRVAGRFDEAVSAMRDALNRASVPGVDDFRVAHRRALLTEALIVAKDYAEAESTAHASIEERERLLGRLDERTTISLSHLAWVYFETKRIDEANERYRDLIDRHIKAGRAGSWLADFHFRGWVRVLDARSNEEDSVQAFDAYTTAALRAGRPTRAVANWIYRKAQILFWVPSREREFEGATKLAVSTCVSAFGAEHSRTLAARNLQALALWLAGRHDEAVSLLRDLEQIGRRPSISQDTGYVLHNLAISIRESGGDCLEVKALLEDAIAERTRADSSSMAVRQFDLAVSHWLCGDAESAERHFANGRQIRLRKPILRHLPFALQLQKTAQHLMKLDKPSCAEILFRDALATIIGIDAKCWRRFDIESCLGESLLRQAELLIESDRQRALSVLATAEMHLIKGVAGTSPHDEHANVSSEAIARLIRLYDFWESSAPGQGHAATAIQWRTRR